MYDTEDIDTVGVVGAGTTGNSIMQMAAMADYNVAMCGLEPEYVERGLSAIDGSLSRFVLKEKLVGDEADTARVRVAGTTESVDPGDYGLVIETVVENADVKRNTLAGLDDIIPEGAVLATNTSTLSITTIAAVTEHPELIVDLHFMNPVSVMKGIEVVRGGKTGGDVVAFVHDFPGALGKETWESDDKPGFVTNRIPMPRFNKGTRAYDEGVVPKEGIDRSMTLGTNVSMGPLTFMDHIGLDTCLGASETLFEELGGHYKPAYLLRHKATAGDLGKKTGEGFYEYD